MSKLAIKVASKPLRARNSFLREDRQRKRAEAQTRQTASALLNPTQRLAKLDKGGPSTGYRPYAAVKERLVLHTRPASALSGR